MLHHDELTVSDEKFSELSAYHLQIGDVVMGRRGEMGRCAVVQTDGLLCGTGSLLIRTKGDVTAGLFAEDNLVSVVQERQHRGSVHRS